MWILTFQIHLVDLRSFFFCFCARFLKYSLLNVWELFRNLFWLVISIKYIEYCGKWYQASDMESPRIIISDSASTSPIRLRSSSFSVSPSSDSLNPSPNTEDLERGLSDDLLCVPNQPQRFHKPRLSIPSLPSWSKSSSPSPAISISSLLTAGRRISLSIPLSIRRRASWSVSPSMSSMMKTTIQIHTHTHTHTTSHH